MAHLYIRDWMNLHKIKESSAIALSALLRFSAAYRPRSEITQTEDVY